MGDSDAVGVLLFFFVFILWVVLCGICGHFRGRTGSGIFWGILLGPIGIFTILFILEDLRSHCGACNKAIPAGAIRCPYCDSQQSQ